ELMRLKQEEPGWYVDAKFEGSDNHLAGLIWLHPKQIEIWSHFHDVILFDTTCKTNRFNMIMCVVVCVNNHNRSCLTATALILDEQKITFEWILQGLLNATGGLAPKARNNTTETTFEKKWKEILDNYSEAQYYLEHQLYPHQEAWVLAFTHRFFNCGIQSTQRVEVYNAILKKLLNGTRSLMEVSEFVRLNETACELPRIMLASYRDHYFMAIDKVCERFLTPAILKLQRYQMTNVYTTDLIGQIWRL
ncbi:2866_t:CDS:2, partial [Racocetra fulgida]